MITDHIINCVRDCMGIAPTSGQHKAIIGLSEFIVNPENDKVFLLKGYAGSGKTTLMASFVQAMNKLKLTTILLAPTGRSAKVFSNYSGQAAYTIHRKIYRQKSSKDGFGSFILGKNLSKDTLFIVDEASMIGNQTADSTIFGSGNLLSDLLEFVYSGIRCKLVIVGDTAQLPPVGLDGSPALLADTYKNQGFSVIEHNLIEVVRQAEESGILYNATKIRSMVSAVKPLTPQISHEEFHDISPITGSDLINLLQESYDKFGMEETTVICRSNKRANQYNKGIRQQLLSKEGALEQGDYLMVVKNNYFWLGENEDGSFIANGDIVKVLKVKKYYEMFGFNFADVHIRLNDLDNREIDARVLLDTLTTESASLGSEDNKKLYYAIYEDYKDEKPKRKGYEMVKLNPFFNALQVKFAYAVTCHKAQGGQWKSVFIDQGYFLPDMLNAEYLRWLYTAFTRATEKLYLINFDKSFFFDK